MKAVVESSFFWQGSYTFFKTRKNQKVKPRLSCWGKGESFTSDFCLLNGQETCLKKKLEDSVRVVTQVSNMSLVYILEISRIHIQVKWISKGTFS